MADKIQLLPDNIANQIAAGEVVQRPASIVKELLENAIDAGGTDITLHIRDAGKTFIQVSDNGSGMSGTDARMCFERHATSKIKKIDDLFSIHTFGFRGEAMASIAAVARVELKTKPAEDETGTQIVIEDSKVISQEPCPANQGTTTTVKNLFFNVPARKNFLKSDKVERKHILEEFLRVALPNPHIKLQFIEDGKQEYSLSSGSLKQRIVQLFGKKLESALIPVTEQSGIVNISGFVAKPEVAKKMRGEQYFFANNRFIKSPYFNHSIMGAYEGLLMPDHFPLYVLFLEVEPLRLDVNVHPTKTEVKFEEEKAIYSILKTCVRKGLSEHHAGPGLSFDTEPLVEKSWMSQLGQDSIHPSNNPSSGFSAPSERRSSSDGHWTASFDSGKGSSGDWRELYKILEDQTADDDSKRTDQPDQLVEQKESAKGPFQVGGKYVITSLKSGLVIIHQRKAHQRILFEKFVAMEDQSASQKLLFPETIELNVKEFALYGELQDTLAQMGFELAEFGKNTLLVHSLPADITTEAPEKIIQDFFEVYNHSQFADTLSLKERVARSLAKSTSIREGSQLNVEEMKALIDQLFACEMPYYHFDGTPILITLSTDDLDKKFSAK